MTIANWLRRRIGRMENRPLRNRIYAVKSFIQSLPTPILVYQMAKVGSTSMCKSLRASGLSPLHIHFLTRKKLRRLFEHHERTPPPPVHLFVSQLLRPYLKRTSHRLKVITLVRDPVTRYVSGQFQSPERSGMVGLGVEEATRTIVRRLSEPDAMEYTFGWFNRELKATFGADVMAAPFHRKQGFGRCRGPRVDVLVLKLEKLSELLPTIVSSFVGTSLQEVRANVGSEKKNGDLYSAVRARLQLPESTLRAIYDSHWVRHFYTLQEVRAFKAKWGSSPVERPTSQKVLATASNGQLAEQGA